jgi:SAM-dependent methyltransferase
LVITRYSFHHFLEPARVLDEMIRVCRPSGRVLVADVAVPAECSVAYDRMESMRDPSHTHALTDNEFAELFAASDLVDCRRTSYDVEMELEAQLRASFPKPGDAERLRQIVTADVGVNALGVQARRDGEEIRFTYPIAVFWGRKETTKTRG